MLVSADDDLLVGAADLDDVERRSGCNAESLALAYGEVVNAGMLADHFAVCGHQVACSIRQALSLLGEVGVDKALVIASGDEADFLRVGLLGNCQSVTMRSLADLRLGHISERKQG